jgi:hypothetical protein
MYNDNTEFLIFNCGDWVDAFSYSEVLDCENVHIYSSPLQPQFQNCRVITNLQKLFFSKKVMSKLNLPFKGLVDFCHILRSFKFDSNKKYVIITTFSSFYLTPSLVKRIRKNNPNVKFCSVMLDMIGCDYIERLKLAKKCKLDKIYTYSRHDSEKFEIDYFPSIYSMPDNEFINEFASKKSYDICFIGAGNEVRREFATKLFQKIMQHQEHIEHYFWLPSHDDVSRGGGDAYLEIPQTNEGLQFGAASVWIRSKCIVEFNTPEVGLTHRYYFAVQNNIKLITNLTDVLEAEFYNDKYIKYIKNSDDITDELLYWATNGELVDYGYNGFYGPKQSLIRIAKDLDF